MNSIRFWSSLNSRARIPTCIRWSLRRCIPEHAAVNSGEQPRPEGSSLGDSRTKANEVSKDDSFSSGIWSTCYSPTRLAQVETSESVFVSGSNSQWIHERSEERIRLGSVRCWVSSDQGSRQRRMEARRGMARVSSQFHQQLCNEECRSAIHRQLGRASNRRATPSVPTSLSGFAEAGNRFGVRWLRRREPRSTSCLIDISESDAAVIAISNTVDSWKKTSFSNGRHFSNQITREHDSTSSE